MEQSNKSVNYFFCDKVIIAVEENGTGLGGGSQLLQGSEQGVLAELRDGIHCLNECLGRRFVHSVH